MSEVRAQIDIAAPPEVVYDLMLDPDRLHEWVSIHRKVNHADSGEPRKGYAMDQTLCLRHANFKVHWTLTEAVAATPRDVGRAEGRRGPMPVPVTGSHPDGDGTHFEYENEFKAPGGLLGKAASRVVVGGVPEREAHRSLQQLKALLNTDAVSTVGITLPGVTLDGRLSRREAQGNPGALERTQTARRGVQQARRRPTRHSAGSATARRTPRGGSQHAAAAASSSGAAGAKRGRRRAAARARRRRCNWSPIAPGSPSRNSPRRWASSRTTCTA